MRPLAADLVRDTRPVVLAVFGAVGLVLLVACANVANLLLSRASHRRRELAVRAAVGATPSRLRRQLLVETGTLGVAGGGVGVLLAAAVLPLLARAVASTLPQVAAPRIDLPVLGFAIAASLASSLLFGLIPAWHLSRTDLRSALNEETRGGSGRRTGYLLVAAELALAFTVLVGAGLLVRSFARVAAVDPGFGIEDRLTLRAGAAGGAISRFAAACGVLRAAVRAPGRCARRARCRRGVGAAARHDGQHGHVRHRRAPDAARRRPAARRLALGVAALLQRDGHRARGRPRLRRARRRRRAARRDHRRSRGHEVLARSECRGTAPVDRWRRPERERGGRSSASCARSITTRSTRRHAAPCISRWRSAPPRRSSR